MIISSSKLINVTLNTTFDMLSLCMYYTFSKP